MSSPPPPPSPIKSPRLGALESSIVLPRRRPQSPSASIANLPFRRSNQSLSTLFASTSSLPGSGQSSGTATPTLGGGSTLSPGGTLGARSPAGVLSGPESCGLRDLIVRAYAPHVAVLASPETDDLIRDKGFTGGFLQLLRPFGEHIQGKVTIRDSIGSSKTWDDFGLRFTGFRDALNSPRPPPAPRQSGDARRSPDGGDNAVSGKGESIEEAFPARSRVGGDLAQIEEVVDRHLSYAEMRHGIGVNDYFDHEEDIHDPGTSADDLSPFYSLYLRRLLSALPMTPHETFSHPVACVIAISSRNPSPIEDLRRLYNATNMGDYRLPQWVNNEFLRYYVLVHDEDRDDLQKSTALFEQMKRHFGLHCHLLRLRSSECIPSDDDSVRLPTTEWISATEELAEIQRRESSEDDTDPTPYLHDTDATALRTFVRELTTQSIIPSMERSLATWNESVLSRRRGISGRFISLSKRWTPFGGGSSSSRASSGGPLAGLQSSGGSSGNYDSLQGFYRPESPEATLRKMADFAVMLRDWKLAASTYDLLRADFNSDKAWRYYAGACEMAVVATLMDALTRPGATSGGGKTRLENVDGWLETAASSYTTRCIAPFYALRTLALGAELLKLRSTVAAADQSAKWHARIIEMGLVAPVGMPLIMQRVSASYSLNRGRGKLRHGNRRRKSAFWALLAAESFLGLGKIAQASKALERASTLYGITETGGQAVQEGEEDGEFQASSMPKPLSFDDMVEFVDAVRSAIMEQKLQSAAFAVGSRRDGEESYTAAQTEADEATLVEEVSEKLDVRPHRKSPSVAAGQAPGLETLSLLSPARVKKVDEKDRFGDDHFE